MISLNQVLYEVSETADFSHLESVGVNTIGLYGKTPLHVAVTWGEVESVGLLVKAGAKIDAVGEYGFTPLLHAVSMGNLEVVKALLCAGADAKLENIDGDDAFALARKLGRDEILKLLKGPWLEEESLN